MAIVCALLAELAHGAVWVGLDEVEDPDPRHAAARFVDEHRRDLRLDDRVTLVPTTTRRGLSGTFVRFSRVVSSIPVRGAEVIVHHRPDGRIDLARTRDLPPARAVSAPAIHHARAERTAREAVDAAAEATGSSLVFLPVGDELRLMWEVRLSAEHPRGRWRVFLDASTGAVHRVIDVVHRADGTARVFSPSPVVTLQDPTLDPYAVLPPEAYKIVALRDLDPPVDGKFHLSGPYARAVDLFPPFTAPPAELTPDFSYIYPDDEGFFWATAYYQLDAIQRFIQALGFTDVNNRRVDFDANGGGARYEPDGNGTGSLALGGSGGDGEIIAHEYGHAVQDNQCPDCYGVAPLSEGFSDFLAAAYFVDQSGGFQDACLFEWSQRFNPSEPTCHRRVDTTKRYPDDLEGEAHLDGEIWSGALWDVLLALGDGTVTVAGRDLAMKLVLESHFLVPEDPSFFEAADALLEADRLLFDGAHRALLESKLAARGTWTPRPGPIVLGRGSGRTDCDGAFSYANPTNRHGPTSTRQVCVDDDPACDADAVPGQCTFRVAACFGLRGFQNCSPVPTIALRLRAPRLDSGSPVSAAIAEALIASVAAAPGAIRDAGDRALVLWNFSPGLAPGACAPPADLLVPLRQHRGQLRRRSVILGMETIGNRPEDEPTDPDRLTLICLPRSS